MTYMQTLSIGELSRRTGASVRSIRHYEQQGLVRAGRSASGHRRFGEEAEETVRRVRVLLEGRLPLAVIAQILPCFTRDGARLDPCVAEYVREHRSLVELRMQELDTTRVALDRIAGLIDA